MLMCACVDVWNEWIVGSRSTATTRIFVKRSKVTSDSLLESLFACGFEPVKRSLSFFLETVFSVEFVSSAQTLTFPILTSTHLDINTSTLLLAHQHQRYQHINISTHQHHYQHSHQPCVTSIKRRSDPALVKPKRKTEKKSESKN
jgi:hypothetical protein